MPVNCHYYLFWSAIHDGLKWLFALPHRILVTIIRSCFNGKSKGILIVTDLLLPWDWPCLWIFARYTMLESEEYCNYRRQSPHRLLLSWYYWNTGFLKLPEPLSTQYLRLHSVSWPLCWRLNFVQSRKHTNRRSRLYRLINCCIHTRNMTGHQIESPVAPNFHDKGFAEAIIAGDSTCHDKTISRYLTDRPTPAAWWTSGVGFVCFAQTRTLPYLRMQCL